jgi:hypothetical protein
MGDKGTNRQTMLNHSFKIRLSILAILDSVFCYVFATLLTLAFGVSRCIAIGTLAGKITALVTLLDLRG